MSDFESKNPKHFWYRIKKVQRVRLRIESFTVCHIMQHHFQNATVLESKALQRVGFWIKNFTTCQIANEKLKNVSGVISKNLNVIYFKSKCSKRVKLFEKSIFDDFTRRKKSFSTILDCQTKIYNLSDNGSDILQRVTFWKESFTRCDISKKITTCQICNWK